MQRVAMSWLKDLRAAGPIEEPVTLWQDVLLGLQLTAEQQVRPGCCSCGKWRCSAARRAPLALSLGRKTGCLSVAQSAGRAASEGALAGSASASRTLRPAVLVQADITLQVHYQQLAIDMTMVQAQVIELREDVQLQLASLLSARRRLHEQLQEGMPLFIGKPHPL